MYRARLIALMLTVLLVTGTVMSDVYHQVTLPDTGDVITVRHWNDQFVDNWNYVGSIEVGEKTLADLGGLELGQSLVWLDGGELVGVVPTYTFTLTYPTNATHLRIIATGMRLDRTTPDNVRVIPNGDYTNANYDSAVYTTISGSVSEYIGGSQTWGFFLGAAPGTANGTGVVMSGEMTIYLANYSGSYDYKHYSSKHWTVGSAAGDIWTGYAWGRWASNAAITTLTFTTNNATSNSIISDTDHGPIRIDIYAMMHG